MRSTSMVRALAATMLALAGAAIQTGCNGEALTSLGSPKYAPKLLLDLPESCNTPDGMTLDEKTNDIYLACPNFNDPNYPGILMKIDATSKLSFFYKMPVHPETKKAGPMGLDIGPDGHLYVADNQYFSDKNYKSRLIRVRIKDGRPVGADVVVDGFKLSNAVIWKDNHVYVSDTFFDIADKPGMSGVYRFSLEEMSKGTVVLKPNASDPHLIATFTTIPNHRKDLAGSDGLTFDAAGNLYTGNFGDGAFSKITFDRSGNVTSNKVIVRSKDLPCVDGIFCDTKAGKIYIADSELNAIQVYSIADGKLTTLWQNADTDGTGGLLDQPCEVLIRGNDLIIVNFDMPFPGLRNTKFDKPHTVCYIKLR